MSEVSSLRAAMPTKRLMFADIPFGRAGRRAFARGIAVVAGMLAVAAAIFRWLFVFAEGLSADGAVGGIALVAQLVGFTIAAAVGTVAFVLGFAFMNLIAKRLRDIGLPGWPSLAVACMLGTAFSLGAPLAATIVYIVAVWVLLFALPTMRRDGRRHQHGV